MGMKNIRWGWSRPGPFAWCSRISRCCWSAARRLGRLMSPMRPMGGSTRPACLNPETGKPYGLDFPIITIADMVRVQKLLLDHLGVKHLLAVIGGSIGRMQVLPWGIA